MILWISGLVVFRSTDMEHAYQVIGMVLTDFRWTPETWYYLKPTVATLGLLYAYHIWQEKEDDELVLLKAPPFVRTAAYAFMLSRMVPPKFPTPSLAQARS